MRVFLRTRGEQTHSGLSPRCGIAIASPQGREGLLLVRNEQHLDRIDRVRALKTGFPVGQAVLVGNDALRRHQAALVDLAAGVDDLRRQVLGGA